MEDRLLCLLFVLEGVRVVEVLRRLHQRHVGVVEVGQRVAQEVRRGDMIRVEDREDVGFDDLHGVVQVTRLVVLVVEARQVVRA